MKRTLLALASVLVVSCACARAQDAVITQPAPESDAAIFTQANAAFAQGVRARATDPELARRQLAAAGAAYQRLIDGRGLHSAGLYYNLANALFLGGDIGHAVLNYLRAQRLDASNRDIANNLEQARAKVGVKADAAKSVASANSVILDLPQRIPIRVRLGVGLAALGLAWVLAFSRLLIPAGVRGVRAPRWAIAAFFLCAGACAGSLWTEARARDAAPPSVVVAEKVVGRKGPDELGYEPSFTEPLRAGVEVVVLESRAGWRLIRLADGRTTWVPESAVERV